MTEYQWSKIIVGFFAGVFLIVSVDFISALARRHRITKAALPDDPDELKKVIIDLRERVSPLSSEWLRDSMAALQSIVVVGALVFGGIWSFGNFFDTRQHEIAYLQARKLELEIDKLKLDTVKRFDFDLELKATQLSFPRDTKTPRFIRVDLSWSSRGNWVPEGSDVLDLSSEDFKLVELARVEPTGDWIYLKNSERTFKVKRGLGDLLAS